MLYLVTGGSGSGKSEYAERLARSCFESLAAPGRLYYIATMYPGKDPENHRRIQRHRQMREGKGFLTRECFCHLERLEAEPGDVLLVECMSNLLANEMYLEGGGLADAAEKESADVVTAPVLRLARQAAGVVVVTNEVFSDGVKYDEETARYLRLLGAINGELAREAEGVVEVVYSIPLWRKGGVLC